METGKVEFAPDYKSDTHRRRTFLIDRVSDGAINSSPAAVERDAAELFQALEDLVGDLYLLGLNECALEDIYSGSNHEGLKALKRHQRYRKEELQSLALGQKPPKERV